MRSLALVFVAALVGTVVILALGHPSVHGDPGQVVRGAGGIVDCLRNRHLVHCDGYVVHRRSGDYVVSVQPFPLLQYVPATALRAVGLSMASAIRAFMILNGASLIAIIGLSRRVLKRLAAPLWAPLVTAILIASPLLWYGRTALGEELAAAVVLGAVVAVLLDARPLIIGLLVAVACITKETNPPFVLALALICLLAHGTGTAPDRRRRLVAIIVGTILGAGLNSAFNIFRFGTVRNTVYMQHRLYAPNVSVVARDFFVQLFAPNGGLAWFWPLAPVAILSVAIVCYRSPGPMRWRRLAAPAVAVLFVGQILLLSTWWTPFGWYAWGPRLVLPLIPGMLVAACVLGARDATRIVARFLTSWWLGPVALLAVAIGLPQAVALFHGLAVTQFFSHPLCVNVGIVTAPTRFYECFQQTAWSKQPWMLQLGMHGLGSLRGRFVAVVFTGAIVTLFDVARRAARDELAEPDASESDDRVPVRKRSREA
jgi:hypothetical protein